MKHTETHMAHRDMIDTIRTVVRLRHRIQMRHELNEIESRAVEEFQSRLAEGQPFRLDVAGLVAGELE